MKNIFYAMAVGIFLLPLTGLCQKNKTSSFWIKIETDQKDSLQIEFADNNFRSSSNYPGKSSIVTSGKLFQRFEILPVTRFSYFTLKTYSTNKEIQYLLNDFMIEPGDSLSIKFVGGKLSFDGRGAEKSRCLSKLATAERKFEKAYMDSVNRASSKGPVANSGRVDSAYISHYPEILLGNLRFSKFKLRNTLNILSTFNDELKPDIYEVIKIDAIAKSQIDDLYGYNFFYKNMAKEISPTYVENVRKQLIKIFEQNFNDELSQFNPSALLLSSFYAEYRAKSFTRPPAAKGNFYQIIKSGCVGTLRDRVLATYFLDGYQRNPNGQIEINDALGYVRTKYCRAIIQGLNAALSKGSEAFNFQLEDEKGKLVSLSDLKGKVVMMDFWFTGCVGCKQIAPHLKAIGDFLKKDSSVAFVSVSIDKEKAKWLNSVEGQQYTHKRSINLYTGGTGTENDLIKHYRITGYPTLLIIDPKGNIFNGNPLRPVDAETERKFIDMLLQAKISK